MTKQTQILLALIAAAGCKKTAIDIGKQTELKDKMCQCKAGDAACAQRVADEMTRWAAEQAKTAGKVDAKEAEAVAKQVAPIMADYTKCMTAAMAPATGSGSDKPPVVTTPPPPAGDHVLVKFKPEKPGTWSGADFDASKALAFVDMHGDFGVYVPMDCPDFTCERLAEEHWLWQNAQGPAFCPKGWLLSLTPKGAPKVGTNADASLRIETTSKDDELAKLGLVTWGPVEIKTLTADQVTGSVNYEKDDVVFKGGFTAKICKK
jgi:hypothetical protein